MTSLFSRLQKLNKEATSAPWEWRKGKPDPMILGGESIIVADPAWFNPQDQEIVVECRNSLSAVLNLIEAAQRYVPTKKHTEECPCGEEWRALRAAVAVFVSGQEEPKEQP